MNWGEVRWVTNGQAGVGVGEETGVGFSSKHERCLISGADGEDPEGSKVCNGNGE